MAQNPITIRGEHLIRKELAELLANRSKISQAIAEAREHGDLKENSEYHAAREQQSIEEARIKRFESILSTSDIIDVDRIASCVTLDRVIFGSLVKLKNLSETQVVSYRIVGEDEADSEKGRISYKSPVGSSLIAKRIGDIVKIETKNGAVEYEVLDIEYSNEPIDAE